MNPISTTYRGATIIFDVRNPAEGHFYAEGVAETKNVGTLRVFSKQCASHKEASEQLLAYARKLIDEANS